MPAATAMAHAFLHVDDPDLQELFALCKRLHLRVRISVAARVRGEPPIFVLAPFAGNTLLQAFSTAQEAADWLQPTILRSPQC